MMTIEVTLKNGVKMSFENVKNIDFVLCNIIFLYKKEIKFIADKKKKKYDSNELLPKNINRQKSLSVLIALN